MKNKYNWLLFALVNLPPLAVVYHMLIKAGLISWHWTFWVFMQVQVCSIIGYTDSKTTEKLKTAVILFCGVILPSLVIASYAKISFDWFLRAQHKPLPIEAIRCPVCSFAVLWGWAMGLGFLFWRTFKKKKVTELSLVAH